MLFLYFANQVNERHNNNQERVIGVQVDLAEELVVNCISSGNENRLHTWIDPYKKKKQVKSPLVQCSLVTGLGSNATWPTK